MASFASLGDVILAEPKSMIGFAGPARHQGNNASGFAGRFPDRGISRRTRADRSDRASQENAGADQPVPQLTFLPPAVGSVAACPERSGRDSLLLTRTSWAGSTRTQRFGIKLGLENVDDFSANWNFRPETTHRSCRRHQRQRLGLRDDRRHLPRARISRRACSSPLTSSLIASGFRSMAK